MTLVLQIAAGILLAMAILAFWRQILWLGALLAVIAVLLVVAGYPLLLAVDSLMANREHIGVWLVIVGVFSLIAWAVYRASQKEAERKQRDAVPLPEDDNRAEL